MVNVEQHRANLTLRSLARDYADSDNKHGSDDPATLVRSARLDVAANLYTTTGILTPAQVERTIAGTARTKSAVSIKQR